MDLDLLQLDKIWDNLDHVTVSKTDTKCKIKTLSFKARELGHQLPLFSKVMTSADQWMKTLRDEKVTAEAKVKIEQVEIQFNNSQKKVNDIMKELKEEREFSC